MKRYFWLPIMVLLLAACGDSSGPGASVANFCSVMGGFDSLDAALVDVEFTPESLEDFFVAISDQIESAAKAAPPEIKSDMETLSEGIALFLTELRKVDYNIFALGDQAAGLEDDKFVTASDNVTAYVKSECGLDLDEDTSDGLSSSDSGSSSSDDGSAAALEGDFQALPQESQDLIVESLVLALGIDPESVECLIEKAQVFDAAGLTEQLAGSEAFDILDQCGLDLSDLGGGAMSDEPAADTNDEDMAALSIELMADLWQTEPENIVCLMGEMGVTDPLEIGTDLGSADILNLFADCGIDLMGLGSGS